MGTLLIVLLTLLTITLLAVIRGFVLSVLWDWFMVPLGVAEIGIAWAIGLSLIVGFFTSHLYSGENKKDAGEIVVGGIFNSLFALFLGWIIHLFM